ncbi:MAG: dihydrolipoyl dehydrogenase [Spirochaetia bacterium]|jgi:dihydrolipoamide dehydrogenase|nr:dihydrolipoyl dehydrogenase [Spirochaetia bacterium]
MYDIIIIGAGPGGYVAAERAGKLGKSVLIIEKEDLGGVCLNRGCIPTKTLLNSSKLFKQAKNSAPYGVHTENASFDWKEAMAWKSEVVDIQRSGVSFLMNENKVEVLKGLAQVLEGKKVSVDGKIYEGENIIISTGSTPFVPPVPGADGPSVVTSREILELKNLPASLAVIGGGVIGMEFASLFSNLGIKVDVIEMMDEIIPMMDKDHARVMRRDMKGIYFHLSSQLLKIEGSRLSYLFDGKEESLETEIVLMAVGRRPNTTELDKIGLDIDKGRIVVNERMQTNLPGIYAVGDVTGLSMLAHSASRMGEVAVNNICGKVDRMRYNAIPWAVYTSPEAAGCGMTEAEAIADGRNVKTASVLMKHNGRFLAEHSKTAVGSCKVVVDAETEILLGVHLIGGISSELVAGAAAMIESELRVNEIKEIIFPHPSLSEVIRDAVWAIV